MSSVQEPLIINNFDQGIADSPHKGFGLFRNADLESLPGGVKVALQPGSSFKDIQTQTFTVNTSTDVCTVGNDVEANTLDYTGVAVYLTTTDTLPAGLSTDTVYFLIEVSDTTFKLATTYGNAASDTQIDITDSGTGTHTVNQVVPGTIKHIARDDRTGTNYGIDDKGRVWYLAGNDAFLLHNSAIDTGQGDVTNGSGGGIAITPFTSTTKTWLFAFRNNLIDVIDVFGTSGLENPSWTNGWQSMNTSAGQEYSHEAIKGQDEAIYFCDSRYIGSIIENVGSTFDPATGSTYTYNNQALDLPTYERAQCLEELGTNLLIGGLFSDKIYPWNRISDSFNLPLAVGEVAIYKMKDIGGAVYVLAGTAGNIYLTQGSYVRLFKKIPKYITNINGTITADPVTWGGIGALDGALLFGMGVQTSGNSGLYKLWPDGRLVIENIPSAGSTNVTAIDVQDSFYTMGYNGGYDTFNSDLYGQRRYTNYETVIHTPLYKVATNVAKAAYSRMEVVFSRIPSDGNIKVNYREGFDDSFSELVPSAQRDLSTLSDYILAVDNIGLTDLKNIQLRVEMNDGATGTDDVELAEIRLFP